VAIFKERAAASELSRSCRLSAHSRPLVSLFGCTQLCDTTPSPAGLFHAPAGKIPRSYVEAFVIRQGETMHGFRMISVSLAMILAFCLNVSGCNEEQADVGSISALIVRESVWPASGVGTTSAIRIVAPDKLSALEAFFPNYRLRPSSGRASAWIAGYQVYFDFPGGETIHVTVSENEKGHFWSVGHGDFDTNGDFFQFVEELSR
jgi:hypothetical protein